MTRNHWAALWRRMRRAWSLEPDWSHPFEKPPIHLVDRGGMGWPTVEDD